MATKKRVRNREMMNVVYIYMILFFALIGYLVYYNATVKETVVDNSYNKRIEVMEQNTIRGKILASDGTVLAKTDVSANGTETRVYPYGNMFAHVIGYNIKGRFGVEKLGNFYMINSNDNPISQVKNDLAGDKSYGDSVLTTLDFKLQKTAYNALLSNSGAIVAIEPSTGKILCMVSKPDFDPNTLDIVWDEVVNGDSFNSVLVNRATQGLYAPGSTFKVFTLLEYFRENPITYKGFDFNCTGSITYDGVTLRCINGHAHGSLDLKTAFAKSCNSTFATIGLGLDKNSYRANNIDLLFNQDLPLDIEYNQSSFGLTEMSETEETMHTAMGQGNTLMTPIHNCMMAAAIANGGVLMKPYIIDKLVNNSGSVVRKFSSEKYKSLMTKEESLFLTDYMKAVVEEGTADVLKNAGYTSAGKTGSAEYDSSNNHHSWFIGFAPAEDPKIAVCVLLEGGYHGYKSATEVAKLVFDQYLLEQSYTDVSTMNNIYNKETVAITDENGTNN